MTNVRKIGRIALPVVGEQLLQVSMGTIDGYLLATLGVVTLSGVSVANSIIVVYQAIFLALGTAVSGFVSSRSTDEDSAIVSEILSLTFLLGLVFGLLSLLFSSQLLRLLGTSLPVASMGGRYLAIVGGGSILLGLMTSLGAYLRARGHYHLPMRVSLLANILNAVLSALSVFVLNWGLEGVAWSTVLSRLMAVLLLYGNIAVPLSCLRWTVSLRSSLCRLAIPVALERLFMRGGDIVTVSLMASFGTYALAGNAIGETLTQFNYMSGFAIATAVVILSAQLKADSNSLKSLLRSSYVLMWFVMSLVACLMVLYRLPLIHLFSREADVVGVASMVTLFSLLGLPATAGTLTLTSLHQGLGNSRLPFYATACGMWLVRLGLGYLLAFPLGLGIRGLYFGTLLDNSFRTVFLYLKWHHYQKKHKKSPL